VANYYYEISDATLHLFGGKYHVASVRGGHDAMMAGGFAVTASADRIWRQDDDGAVKFVKHRHENPETAKVDLKEFMWVKLSSKLVDV
jgi:hypothetical protein